MDYSEAVREMKDNIPAPDDFGFEEYREQVRELGDPQQEVPVIHVAGTNGKGSTCHIIYSMLRKAGYSVGLFTGPHLEEMVERIEVNGKLIEREELADIYGEIRDDNLSMFESLTVIAFKHYIRKDVDVAVIEAGLGGRKDATNIVEPEVSVITNVGLDHQHILGETIPEIAREKAGIIKECKPVITNSDGAALEEIRQKAEDKSSEAIIPNKHVKEKGKIPLKLKYGEETFKPSIQGAYQIKNINAAIEAIKACEDFEITSESVVEGLKNLNVPGRMEKVSENPDIFLDGAHNEEGVKALAGSLKDFDTIVFGCMEKKPYREMMETLEPYARKFIFTRPDSDNAWNPENEADGTVVKDPLKAVKQAEGRTLVTGSLYLVGEVRKKFKA